MKKIVFIMPLMAVSLLASCNNNAELPSYYTRRDCYSKGLFSFYELYEYDSKHLVSKVTRYNFPKDNPEEFNSVTETTYKYNSHELLEKEISNTNEPDESTGEMKLSSASIKEFEYDANLNETMNRRTDTTYSSGEESVFIQTAFTDIKYDYNKNITEKVSTHYTKSDDEAEEFEGATQYTYTYDSMNRVLSEIDSYAMTEGDFHKKHEKNVTYVDKKNYQDFETMEEIFYKDDGQTIDHSIKYINQFDNQGRISSQRMIDTTPIDPENEEVEQYVDIEYAYDPNNNIIRRLGRAYEVTESETKISLAMEENYAYLNYNPNKPIYSIASGFNKYFGSSTKIKKYEYDQHGRITFSEDMEFDRPGKPKTYLVYTYSYN